MREREREFQWCLEAPSRGRKKQGGWAVLVGALGASPRLKWAGLTGLWQRLSFSVDVGRARLTAATNYFRSTQSKDGQVSRGKNTYLV